MNDFDNIVDNIPNTQIMKSEIHGFGLFAKNFIKKDSILGILDGQYVPATEYFYKIFEWNVISKDVLLVRPCRTKYSYINHSRNPNLLIAYNPIRIVALMDIECDQELMLDYRKENLSFEYLSGHGASYL